jgi:hypothetical protein
LSPLVMRSQICLLYQPLVSLLYECGGSESLGTKPRMVGPVLLTSETDEPEALMK